MLYKTKLNQLYITIFLSIAALTLVGCSTSNQLSESSIQTTVIENPELYSQLSISAASTRERGFFSPLIGTASSLGANAIEQLIINERERTTLKHYNALSDLYFYDQLSELHPLDPTGIQFEGLEIIRWKENKQSSARDTALYISLKIDHSNAAEILNNSFFRLKVADLKVFDSEVPSNRRWYNPISWFRSEPNKLNFSMIITFLGSWIDGDMNVHSEVPMGRFVLSFEDYPLYGHPEYDSFWQNPPQTQVMGYSYIIPRSIGFTYDSDNNITQLYGQGRFSIQIESLESKVDKLETIGIVKIAG